MTAALRYEWRRLASLRSTWWITSGSVVAGAGFTFFMAMILRLASDSELRGSPSEDDSRFFLEAAMTQFSNVDPMFYLLAYAVAILGILSWGHEYRHGMIRATLTAVPDRTMIWVAKFLVIAVWVAVVVVISCIASLIFTLLWFSGLDLHYDFGALLVAMFKRIVYSVLLSWLVMSVTVLIRHQTFSLVLLYLWPLGIESMLKLVFGIFAGVTGNDDAYDTVRFLPFNAGGRIMQNWSGEFQENLDLFGDPLSALGGFIVFGGFVFVLMGASLYAFHRRDA